MTPTAYQALVVHVRSIALLAADSSAETAKRARLERIVRPQAPEK